MFARPLKRLTLSLALLAPLPSLGASLLLSGCDSEEPAPAEESFGLPGKGDLACDPRAALCWGDADASAARALMGAETEVMLGEQPLSALLSALTPLEHKLSAEELTLVESLRAREAAGEALDPVEGVTSLIERGYGRALSGYWGAHATLFSEVASTPTTETQGVGEKADEVERAPLPSALMVPSALRPAFEALWAQGLVGQYLATMFALAGVADHEPLVTPLQQRALVTQLPIDTEAGLIAARFARASAWESVFSNAQALIPVAGVWISVPYGLYSQFKVRAKLALELATLYGLNPRHNADDFLLTVQLLTAAQGFREAFSSMFEGLIGAQSYKLLSERRPDLLTEDFSERRVSEVIKVSLGQLAIVGARMLASLGDEAILSAGKALLSQVTFGVTALADVTLDYFNTRFIGRELRYTLHPWGWVTYLEGAPLLADEDYRRCAHAGLVTIARADGDVTEREARLMLEALTRPFDASEEGAPRGAVQVQPLSAPDEVEWVTFADPELVFEHLDEAVEEPDFFVCMSDTWAEEDSLTQLTMLSWLELMAHADGELSPREEDRLAQLAEGFEVSVEERRVYEMMRARVAAHPTPLGELSTALWMWSAQAQSSLEAVTGAEATLKVWERMRED